MGRISLICIFCVLSMTVMADRGSKWLFSRGTPHACYFDPLPPCCLPTLSFACVSVPARYRSQPEYAESRRGEVLFENYDSFSSMLPSHPVRHLSKRQRDGAAEGNSTVSHWQALCTCKTSASSCSCEVSIYQLLPAFMNILYVFTHFFFLALSPSGDEVCIACLIA